VSIQQEGSESPAGRTADRRARGKTRGPRRRQFEGLLPAVTEVLAPMLNRGRAAAGARMRGLANYGKRSLPRLRQRGESMHQLEDNKAWDPFPSHPTSRTRLHALPSETTSS
jgi:hypothetical protein